MLEKNKNERDDESNVKIGEDNASDTGVEDDFDSRHAGGEDKTELESVVSCSDGESNDSDTNTNGSDADDDDESEDEDENEREKEDESESTSTVSVISDKSNDVKSVYSVSSINRVEGPNVLASAGSGVAFLLLMSFITGIIEIIIYRNRFKR